MLIPVYVWTELKTTTVLYKVNKLFIFAKLPSNTTIMYLVISFLYLNGDVFGSFLTI